MFKIIHTVFPLIAIGTAVFVLVNLVRFVIELQKSYSDGDSSTSK